MVNHSLTESSEKVRTSVSRSSASANEARLAQPPRHPGLTHLDVRTEESATVRAFAAQLALASARMGAPNGAERPEPASELDRSLFPNGHHRKLIPATPRSRRAMPSSTGFSTQLKRARSRARNPPYAAAHPPAE